MLERLSEAEQVERYRGVRQRLMGRVPRVLRNAIKPLPEIETLREKVKTLTSEITWLRQSHNPDRLRTEDCMRAVSLHFGVSRTDIVSQRRDRSIVRPRQVAMYLARKVTTQSLPEIGRRIGERDHTTVLHAIRQVTRLMEADEKFRRDVETIESSLGNAGGTGA